MAQHRPTLHKKLTRPALAAGVGATPAFSAQANQATPARSGPQRFGRYILLNQLGAGGMAEVFRAVVVGPEQFQRVLVVKRILPRMSAKPSFVKMFIDEATLCGRLSHPNIIQVHEFGRASGPPPAGGAEGEAGEQHFIAMEYVHGRTLNQVLRRLSQRRQPLPFTIAAEIMRQVCRGLAYAHTLTTADGRPLGIIHRDVSPGNVMVAYSGQVKLLDFGIARAEARFRVGDTQPGQVKGKSAYLAPEQITSDAVDHRADIFAAGILLFEMVTGRRLFKAATPLECMNLVTSLPIPLPSQLVADLPAALEAIVLRALRRHRDERYQSAADMADDLERFLVERQALNRDLPGFAASLFADEMTQEGQGPQLGPDELVALAALPGAAAVAPPLVSTAPAPATDAHADLAPSQLMAVGARGGRRAGWLAMALAGVSALALWQQGGAFLASASSSASMRTPAPALGAGAEFRPPPIATERNPPPASATTLAPAAPVPAAPQFGPVPAAGTVRLRAPGRGSRRLAAVPPASRPRRAALPLGTPSNGQKVRDALPIDPFAE